MESEKIIKFKQILWRLLQRGSSIERNIVIGIMLIILIIFGVIGCAMLQDLTQEDAILLLVLSGVGIIYSMWFIIYVIGQHGKYRKVIREKFEALTEEEIREIAVDLSHISKAGPIIWGAKRVYGDIVALGKPCSNSFSWIDYKDIVWAYEMRETYPWAFHRNHPNVKNGLILRDGFGNGYRIDGEKAYYDDELQMIKQKVFRCRIGYSRDRNKIYKMDPATFHYKYDL